MNSAENCQMALTILHPSEFTKPHALVMLKLLALDDRYRNIRGPAEARHDREEARTHAADIVAILSVQPDLKAFLRDFEKQFIADLALGVRVLKISDQYFPQRHLARTVGLRGVLGRRQATRSCCSKGNRRRT
jgi:hypothetical protein